MLTREVVLQDEADTEAFEPPEFQGMLYYDGVDSLGRPVVVVNADAVAAKVPAWYLGSGIRGSCVCTRCLLVLHET